MQANPCALVIFGATGDLTSRKLMPALYNLEAEKQLAKEFVCVGFARRPKTNEEFRKEMHEGVLQFSRTQPIDDAVWTEFQNKLFYHVSDFDQDDGYLKLAQLLKDLDAKFGTRGNRVFYLSIQPSYFPLVIKKLHQHGLVYSDKEKNGPWSRVIIEKPFGHDLNSSIALQNEVTQCLSENQVYRIDHYLGKETVQNLLIFRFTNPIFESIWNNRAIDHIQITAAEDIGVGSRGRFYEEAGIIRDIVQNHVMQLLSLVAMEPPVSIEASSIHDEKVKALRSIRPFDPADFENQIVRGQYKAGTVDQKAALGYRQETNVDPNSFIPTFTAMRLYIDNWRWAGVPFYIRAGKRLPKRSTEISIVFKQPPSVLFNNGEMKHASNILTIRIQPNEGIGLKINTKVPGPSSPIQPVEMDFRYNSYFGKSSPEAYERLICDCMLGESTLFARIDEVEASWKLFTPLLEYWEKTPPKDFPNYAAGTWGPQAAETLIQKDNRKWHLV